MRQKGNGNMLITRCLKLPFLLVLCLPSVALAEGLPVAPGTRLGAHGIAFSSDDKLLAIAHKKGADVWDIKAKKRVTFLESNQTLFSVAFSPDGSSLVAGSLAADVDSKPPTALGHIYLWDLKSKKLRASADCANETVISVSFFAGGEQIIAGGESLALYDARKLTRIADSPGWMGPFAVIKEGKQLIAVQRREARICVAELDAKNSLRCLAPICRFGQDEEKEAASSKRSPNLDAGTRKFKLDWTLTRCLATARDGKQLAVPSKEGFKVYDLGTAILLSSVRSPKRDSAVYLAFSPDGKSLAFGNFSSNSVSILDTSSQKEVRTFTCHFPNLLDLCYSHDGTIIASLSIFPFGGEDDPMNAFGGYVDLWKLDR
jgi:WD40 repeat protein